VFGRCRKEDVRRTFLYAAYDGIAFRDDAGGANAVIVNHGTDTGSRCAVLEAAGPEGLVFLNAQLVPLGEHEKGAIIVDPRFFGKASFYNSQMWAGNVTAIVEGSGDVLLQQLNTLSGPVTLEGGRCTLESVLFARDLDPAITVAEGCASARVVAGVTPGVLRVQNGAGERCTCVGGSLSRQPAPGTSGFSTGFEPGDPQPTEDTIATSGGGIRSVSSPSCRVVEGLGRDGGRALRVYGVADDPEYSYAYFTVFAEPLVVHSGSMLSYWLKPENERGQCVGIDVLFADGQVMRDAGVQDSEGRGTHPGGQRGTIGQWTQVTIPIGRYRANAEIKAILFAYDSRGGGGPFEALVDDVLSTRATGARPGRYPPSQMGEPTRPR